AMADLAKSGPIRSQSEGVVRLLHSDQTVVHLVTLLEALPVQETADAVEELEAADLRMGTVIVNRTAPEHLPEELVDDVAAGRIAGPAIRTTLEKVSVKLSDDDFAGLLTETIEHAAVLQAQQVSAAQLDEVKVARMSLPALADGVDLGGLYELADVLAEQGVR